jgi:hypothetical protein
MEQYGTFSSLKYLMSNIEFAGMSSPFILQHLLRREVIPSSLEESLLKDLLDASWNGTPSLGMCNCSFEIFTLG